MIIYEVNITLNNRTYNDYIEDVVVWLKSHAKEMLLFSGFKKYKIFFSQDDKKDIIIHYYVETLQDIEIYLEKHSKEMRKSNKYPPFVNSFLINRRILVEQE